MYNLKSNFPITHNGEKKELTVGFSLEPSKNLRKAKCTFCGNDTPALSLSVEIESIICDYEDLKATDIEKKVKLKLRRMVNSIGHACTKKKCFGLQSKKMAEVFPS